MVINIGLELFVDLEQIKEVGQLENMENVS